MEIKGERELFPSEKAEQQKVTPEGKVEQKVSPEEKVEQKVTPEGKVEQKVTPEGKVEQKVVSEGKGLQKELHEGKARILYNDKEVFYNPIQQFNRDLSILVIKLFIQQLNIEESENRGFSLKKRNPLGIEILEALSATGLRSIRYFKEIPGIHKILVNDLEPAAVATIRQNLIDNEIDPTRCVPNQGDCNFVMNQIANQPNSRFDVIDLDPYGTASPFLDAAVKAVDSGGLLCVTCTDLAVLCGSNPETCYAKYQAIPLKSEHCHETALRIVLNNIQSHAIRYKRYIEPVISIYVDFYVRIFVRVYDSANATKEAFSRSGMVFQCGGCKSFWTQRFGVVETDQKGNKKYKMKIGPTVDPKCQFCGSAVKMGGPMWLDPLHDNAWLTRAIEHLSKEENKQFYQTHKRILGLLSICNEELQDSPLFYIHSALCNTCKLETPSLVTFRSALLSAGYHVSGSHCAPSAIKTNAPNEVIWDIIRSINLKHPAKLQNLHEESPGRKILAVQPKIQIDFTIRKDAELASGKLSRFIKTPGGGPKPRAKGKRSIGSVDNPSDEHVSRRRKVIRDNNKPTKIGEIKDVPKEEGEKENEPEKKE